MRQCSAYIFPFEGNAAAAAECAFDAFTSHKSFTNTKTHRLHTYKRIQPKTTTESGILPSSRRLLTGCSTAAAAAEGSIS